MKKLSAILLAATLIGAFAIAVSKPMPTPQPASVCHSVKIVGEGPQCKTLTIDTSTASGKMQYKMHLAHGDTPGACNANCQ